MDDDEEDLDELLDEVEKKFCSDVSVGEGSSQSGPRKLRTTNTEEPASSITEDINTFLKELLEEEGSTSPQLKTEQFPGGAPAEKKPTSQSAGRKCCPVFVGGSSITCGIGTVASKRSCDQLRCTSCDFRVLMFDDCGWHESCDYLFLRNNMPERQKLRAKLRRSRGCRAYACQCCWFSSLELMDLRTRPQLSWVCGKHQD